MAKTSTKLGKTPTTVISVRVKPELKRAVEMMAIARRVTTNAYCADVLTRASMPAVSPPTETADATGDPAADDGLWGGEEGPSEPYTGNVNDAVPVTGDVNPPTNAISSDDRINITSLAALQELRRIGNNLNQIARAANSGKPIEEAMAFDVLCLRHLFEALADTPEYQRRLNDLKRINLPHDPPYTQARQQLSGGGAVRTA